MTPAADRTLQEILLRGGPQVWPDLYRRLGASLYAVARALTHSTADAEDLVQQTFLELYRARQSFERAESPRAYAFAVLRNSATRLRKRARTFEPLSAAEEPQVAAEAVDAGEFDPRLERALASLPAEQREVLALKLDGELTFAQIASVLEIPLDTAASRYRRALEKLRERLEEQR